ncbi:hypothetical protein [Corynebacterium alimapuense]|uniref:Uncharacterized protein n=1 Tax=Corynebacterium alimapuense TaxID=1576874 RepID=A0A3M8KAY2_9CORY|nr:hypothetical protein [Corynebacterium alimapuense]RNE49618.1 hypothetical protein C5L39_04555 [Corynebacterium alimapuense]
MDLKARARSDQFTVELIRAMPQLSIPQALSASIQLSGSVDFSHFQDFNSIRGLVAGLQLRPLSEWEAFGYAPTEDAPAIKLEVPREKSTAPVTLADHYLSAHTRRVSDEATHLIPHDKCVNGWRRRLGSATAPSPRYANFTTSERGRRIPQRRIEMLGNLWKVGAVASWELIREDATSWCHPDYYPQAGERPHPGTTNTIAWYHIRLHPDIGRDAVVEIARCLAEISLGYVEKFWGPESEPGTLRGPESEAAAYIALERLWVPQRSRHTDWFLRYKSGEPMDTDFRWEAVFRAAAEIEDILRGDTEPVIAH